MYITNKNLNAKQMIFKYLLMQMKYEDQIYLTVINLRFISLQIQCTFLYTKLFYSFFDIYLQVWFSLANYSIVRLMKQICFRRSVRYDRSLYYLFSSSLRFGYLKLSRFSRFLNLEILKNLKSLKTLISQGKRSLEELEILKSVKNLENLMGLRTLKSWKP